MSGVRRGARCAVCGETPRATTHRSALIHFLLSSDSQLVTSETGHATIVCVTAGCPSAVIPCVITVHSTAIDCSVFPSPMSSARMQPAPSYSRSPITQSKQNCTPSRWCGRSHRHRKPSTSTGAATGAFGFGFGFVFGAPSSPSPSSPAPPSPAPSSPSPSPSASDSASSGGGGRQSTSGSNVYSSSSAAAAGSTGGIGGGTSARLKPPFSPPSDLLPRLGSKDCTFDGSCCGSLNAACTSATFARTAAVMSFSS